MEKQGNVIYMNQNQTELLNLPGLVSLEDELTTVLTDRDRITKEFAKIRNELKRR